MSDDIVARLRGGWYDAMSEAADKIERLTAERDELRALLRKALAHLKTGQWAVPTDITLMSRIDAALKGDDRE